MAEILTAAKASKKREVYGSPSKKERKEVSHR